MKNYTINYAVANFKGYGHYQITVELLSEEGERATFKATTTNMRAIDDSKELEGEEKYQLLFDTIEYLISDAIEEWALNTTQV